MLLELADCCRTHLWAADIVGHYRGRVISPGVANTPLSARAPIVECGRLAIAVTPNSTVRRELHVTASLGMVDAGAELKTANDLSRRASCASSIEKRSRRDRLIALEGQSGTAMTGAMRNAYSLSYRSFIRMHS